MSAPAHIRAGAGSLAAPGWRSVFALAGGGAAALYLVAVVIGGFTTPGYSHLASTISELTLAGAPNGALLSALFVAYDVLVIVFALAAASATVPASRTVVAGAWLLGLVGVAGIGMSTLFPTDRPIDPVTATGWVHIGLAAFASLGSMATILLFALGLRRLPEWRSFALFSIVSLALIFVSGVWAAASAAQLSPLMGLAERVTIGVFIVWLLVFSVRLARSRQS